MLTVPSIYSACMAFSISINTYRLLSDLLRFSWPVTGATPHLSISLLNSLISNHNHSEVNVQFSLAKWQSQKTPLQKKESRKNKTVSVLGT